MTRFVFDANSVDAYKPFDEVLPAGSYLTEIANVGLQETRSGNGRTLKVEYTVIEPELHARRKFWEYLNVEHTDPKTKTTALSRLSALCHAVGLNGFNDIEELLGRVVRVRTKIREGSNGYGPSPEVLAYEMRSNTSATASNGSATSAPAAPARPWERA